MKKIKVILFVCGIILLLGTYTFADVPIMTVDQLKPGMKGIGKTVIRGTVPEEFDIEIVGVLKKGGFTGGSLILVKCTGPVIDATGGVAGGYSGSPIYIDGKMIGALSAAWYFADHSIAGVTPINDMLKTFYYPDETEKEIKLAKLDEPINICGRNIDSTLVNMDYESTRSLEKELGDNTMVLTACRTPLFVNGLSPMMVDKIKEYLGPKLPYMEIMTGTGGGMVDTSWDKITLIDSNANLEPGSAIGMQLVTGDIDLTAVGTLTYIDPDDADKRILVFGHPFLMRGPVDAPITSARIVFTIPAIDRSFKMGEAISLVGSSSQDRACAVSGMLGKIPDLVKIHFEINDVDQDKIDKYDIGVIRDEDMMSFLTLLPVQQGMMQTMNRMGKCTAKIDFKIDGEGLAEPIVRENYYYSEYGGFEIINELMEVLFTLTSSNIFREVTINEIKINIELTQNRQTIDIVEIDFPDDGKKKEEKPSTTENTTAPQPDTPTDPSEILINIQDGEQPPQGMMTESDMEAPPPIMAQTEIKSFKPGDKVRVKVVLKPYREETFEQILEIKIPDDINTGMTQIVVRGGGGYPNRFMMGGMMPIMVQQNIPMQGMYPGGMPMEKAPKSLDEIIEKFLKRDHNNEIVIELMRPPSMTPPKKEDRDKIPEPIKSIQTKDKIIYGTFMLPIEIKKPEEAKKEETKPVEGEESQTVKDEPKPAPKGEKRK